MLVLLASPSAQALNGEHTIAQTQRHIDAIDIRGDSISIEGQQLGGGSGRWNADSSVYTYTVRDVSVVDGLALAGDAAVPIRNVSLDASGENAREHMTVSLVAEVVRGAEVTVRVLEDGTRVTISFSMPETADADVEEEAPRSGYEMVYLRYGEAESLANLLRRLASGGERAIQVEDRLNVLVIDRTIERYEEVLELIASLDQPGEQILIDAQIVELRDDAASQLGIDFPSSITMSTAEDSGHEQMVPFPFQTFLRSPIEISATLDLLKGDGRADILANPRVATLGGVPAVVQTQERFPIIVTQTSGSNTYQTKQDIVGGISLSITPRHNGAGEITTVIETDVTTITGTTKEGYPTTSSRNVSTTVRVRSGQAIVIGGLQERRDIVHDDKVPLLGDIPLLGLLFTNRRTETTRTDLYVIVTPYLIGGQER
jgi:type II secretory pathway component GspD/PulD (secretin)